jgi:hypothetical protein
VPGRKCLQIEKKLQTDAPGRKIEHLQRIVGRNLRFSQDTFDSPGLETRFNEYRIIGSIVPSGAHAPRLQALVGMLKVNTVIHTVESCHSEHKLRSVIPYFETNRLRPRIAAIKKTRPFAYRTKVLGRALLATRTDANSLWMLLSRNPEVSFPSTNTTTTPVANLPMPATAVAAATSNAATVAAAAVAFTVPRYSDCFIE